MLLNDFKEEKKKHKLKCAFLWRNENNENDLKNIPPVQPMDPVLLVVVLKQTNHCFESDTHRYAFLGIQPTVSYSYCICFCIIRLGQ